MTRYSRLPLLLAMPLVCLAYYGTVFTAPWWLRWLGLDLIQWGLDAHAVLAAADTAAAGGDVYAPMALDPLNRLHSYSSWWLVLADLGVTRAELAWFAGATVLVFLVAMFWRLQPRSWTEVAVFAAAACSTPVIFGLIRANNDLVIFALLAPVVPCLQSRAPLARLLAPLLIACAAGLKYYPVIAGVVLLGAEDLAQKRRALGAFALLLVAVLWSVWSDLPYIAVGQPFIAQPMSLGAFIVLRELHLSKLAAFALCALIVIGLVAGAVAWRTLRDWTPPSALRTDYLQFLLGAVVLTGCFWAGPSHGYRWIFALLMLPFLLRVQAVAAQPAAMRRLLAALLGLLALLMFGESLFAAFAFLLERKWGWSLPGSHFAFTLLLQPLAWFFFGALTMLLAQFAFANLLALRRERGLGLSSPVAATDAS